MLTALCRSSPVVSRTLSPSIKTLRSTIYAVFRMDPFVTNAELSPTINNKKPTVKRNRRRGKQNGKDSDDTTQNGNVEDKALLSPSTPDMSRTPYLGKKSSRKQSRSTSKKTVNDPKLPKERNASDTKPIEVGIGYLGIAPAVPNYSGNIHNLKFFKTTNFDVGKLGIRPSIVSFEHDEEYTNQLTTLLKALFPEGGHKFLPISKILGEQKILPNQDPSDIDWTTTFLLNNHHDKPLVGRVERLMQHFEKRYINFASNSVTQKRNFSNYTRIPLNEEEFEITLPKFDQYNKLTKAMVESPTYNLSKIVPSVDDAYYDKSTLGKFTTSRYNDIHAYLSALNKHSQYHPRLSVTSTFKELEKTLLLINDCQTTLFSIDLEAFERNNNFITEIGITIYDPTKEAASILPNFTKIHLIVEENKDKRNGTFVADNQQAFIGGNSIVLPLAECVIFVQCLVNYYFIIRQSKEFHAALVGHNVGGDIKWLKKIGVVFPENLLVLDTQKLYQMVNGDKYSGLGAILRRFQIPHSYLHNGGNDSYFTLILLMKLGDVTFRDRFKVDDYNCDLKHMDDFKAFKEKQPAKLVAQKASKTASGGSSTAHRRTGPKKSESYEFAFDRIHKSSYDALKSSFEN